ncbi:hypothetical protein K488DRAFT_88317 [Vararia minispora EC-137]|uniref:Uncharacterized protein n=1 Tax=Vararia minispora EC-137 TaxID=1314806 RepID=A0ACB8QDV9_9AGAM|nr:hypothetical protein K488DRAFT_88317 [Vararia minispora EC-137]
MPTPIVPGLAIRPPDIPPIPPPPHSPYPPLFTAKFAPPPSYGPSDFPDFPPPGVFLHKDDASSKVLRAIGRSFLSVENRAMTIKDLSEMTMKFGLICQNVSAAGQAITTFIRNHQQRCEQEQDQPLLSRHVLSGTPSDDELVPALHSRSGGAHCALPPSENRITNFRRGTMVWYLSRAAGAPCPFARAGIRLAEYTEDGKLGCPPASGPRDRKRERDRRRRLVAAQQQLCGQKRKRLARSCKVEADAGSDDESAGGAGPVYEDEGVPENEPEARPPKVKLTLRLRPSLTASSASPSSSASPPPAPGPAPIIRIPADEDDEDDGNESESDSDSSMAVDSDADEDSVARTSPGPSFVSPPPSAFFRMPSPSSFAHPLHLLRRSPSVASLPPDSEDDDDDDLYEHSRIDFDDEDDMDWSSEDEDEDEDEEGVPEAKTVDETVVIIKQEPVDEDAIGGLLQAWDTRDRGAESRRILEVVAAAASLSTPSLCTPPPDSPIAIKREELDEWDLRERDAEDSSTPLLSPVDEVVLSPVEEWSCASFARSSASPLPMERGRRPSELLWQDAEILGLETITAKELDEGEWIARRPTPPPPVLAPSPEAESEEDAVGPCTPPSSSVPVATAAAVWSGSSPFGFGNRRFGEREEETVGKGRRTEEGQGRGESERERWGSGGASAFGAISDAASESDGEREEGHAHSSADGGLSLWDMDELRRCVPSVPRPPSPAPEEPLSPTEEAMLHVLCDLGDFADGPADAAAAASAELESVERPLTLRRSKRVQAAAAARKATAGPGGGRQGRKRGAR